MGARGGLAMIWLYVDASVKKRAGLLPIDSALVLPLPFHGGVLCGCV